MKLSLRRHEQGSIMVVALITCLVIGIALATYLALISNRYKLTMRSMTWNAAIPIAEAGVEEAFSHLTLDTNSPAANSWTATTIGGQPVHTKQRTNSDGSYFSVAIYNAASTNPAIYSTGFVPAPEGQGYISRMVGVTATKPKAFLAGITANGLVTLSGGAIVDSYSSCAGAYSSSNSLGGHGAIATNSRLNPAVKVGTGHVYGTVTTGPGGTVSVAGGSVGDPDWNATHTGIQPGMTNNDMNVAFPTNSPPTGPFSTPPVIVAGGSNITALAGGTYQMASFTSSDSSKPMVVSGDATLYLVGNLTVSGSGFIQILPGASLTVYVGGNNPVISGGGVVNLAGDPKDFTYIGLSSSTKLTYSGSAAFIGTVNAPQAAMTISGSAGTFGAVIVNTFTSSGGSSFHYDECLGQEGQLTLTSWREL